MKLLLLLVMVKRLDFGTGYLNVSSMAMFASLVTHNYNYNYNANSNLSIYHYLSFNSLDDSRWCVLHPTSYIRKEHTQSLVDVTGGSKFSKFGKTIFGGRMLYNYVSVRVHRRSRQISSLYIYTSMLVC